MTEVASVPDRVPEKAPGLPARMVGVLLSPKETFAAVAATPRWLGVMIATLIVTSACTYVILSSPDMQDAIIDQQISRMESGGATVSDEQIAASLGERSMPLDEVCQRLVEAANAAGGPDNITALVLEVDAP